MKIPSFLLFLLLMAPGLRAELPPWSIEAREVASTQATRDQWRLSTNAAKTATSSRKTVRVTVRNWRGLAEEIEVIVRFLADGWSDAIPAARRHFQFTAADRELSADLSAASLWEQVKLPRIGYSDARGTPPATAWYAVARRGSDGALIGWAASSGALRDELRKTIEAGKFRWPL